MNRRQSGYSLVEILVVVGIIGIISLVTVPNFISLQRTAKIKSSMRNFVSDIRGMRQRAVTRHTPTKLSFTTGTATTARNYSLWEWDATATPAAWKQIGPTKRLEEACYIESKTNFNDVDGDGTWDIVFRVDGTPLLAANVFQASAVLKTDWNIPTPQYTITVKNSGSVSTS